MSSARTGRRDPNPGTGWNVGPHGKHAMDGDGGWFAGAAPIEDE